ncbi:hypothetical protein Back11_25920 [Paenibacillus baekrokdamisoli]|uniref:Uncharacterized protein n=1 Tax=Paenibacillus baekrokdamisoli TaxID=1712516 RepID=A0A3G9IQU6_9BACL|nr:hypothetical protein [Paenibacillus baekrokdamisoli]MBB3070242.1 hypothetical protein [Paenibacillus baekrokdamisoli]BBH21247.1 hypothetical protein Back11_25920 [Paenibacillus baekrokdamisoli]
MAEPITLLNDDLFNQLQTDPFVLLHTIAADGGSPTSSAISWIYAVDHSTLRFAIEALEDVPFKLVCFDIEIGEIRDAMFYGARLSTQPEYEKTYDKRAADKLDGQVFAAMKKA